MTLDYSRGKGVAGDPQRGRPEAEKGSHHRQPLRLVEGYLHQLSSVVGARAVLTRHTSNTCAFGTDVIERGTYSHEDSERTGSEKSRPCTAKVLVGIDRRVEEVELRQFIVVLDLCCVT